MSWGQELWDQYPALSDHTHKGIEFLDKFGSFLRERSMIELEYAGKLKRLAKHHQIKKKDEEENQFSYCKAFLMMLGELTDYANQHEVIAENISQNIVKEISVLLKELKEERKRYLQEGQRNQNAYAVSLSHLEKAKKSYEKAFKEADRAHEAFLRADADLNLSRAEVEKAKNFSIMKGQIGDETKTEYANQLQKTNELQRRHFNEWMPKVFNQLQELEERRITCLQTYMKQTAQIENQVLPIITKCLEGVVSAAESIDPSEDSRLVIERHKSGNLPPVDFPFEDLSNPSTIGTPDTPAPGGKGSSHLNYSNSIKSETLRGTLSIARLRKRGGLLNMFSSNKGLNFDEKNDDFSDLPPNQRRKKIVAKIDSIQSQINQELAVRDGLLKMKAAYEANPIMGDPHSVEGQMSENSHKLDRLKTELAKFQGFLDEVDGKDPAQFVSNKCNLRQHRNSVSESGSLSRSASDSSFSQQNGSSQQTTSAGNNNSLTTTVTASHDDHHHNNHNNNGLNSSSSSNSPSIRNSVALQNHRNSNGNLANGSSLVDSLKNHLNSRVNGNSADPSPESGISTSHLSIPDADYVDDVPDGEEEFDEVLPVLGKARALYPFEAQSEGSIGMDEGEELDVVELDQGDGWTRVRKITNEEEGFVPTSYIEVEMATC